MKKTLLLCTVAVLMIRFLVPLKAHASETSVMDENMVYTDIEDFLANKAYYDALVLQGVGVSVSVGNEYSDAEVESLLNLPSSVSKSSDFSTWGLSVPTAEYNVHNSPLYQIARSTSSYSILYSNYKFTGCTWYLIDVFNYDYNNKLKMTVYGTKDGTVHFGAEPRCYIYKSIKTNSTTDSFFFAFSPICDAAGTINCCPAQ